MTAPYATIWRADSPLARCSVCGTEQQFHSRVSEPHDFVAETAADIEPGDLQSSDLVREIFTSSEPMRGVACREELRGRVASTLGVAWDDLQEALA